MKAFLWALVILLGYIPQSTIAKTVSTDFLGESRFYTNIKNCAGAFNSKVIYQS